MKAQTTVPPPKAHNSKVRSSQVSSLNVGVNGWSLNAPSGVSYRIKPVNPSAALPVNLNAFNA